MICRTYEADAEYIETTDDLDNLVHDKCENWTANYGKAWRLQCRYYKRLRVEYLKTDYSDDK